jgi:hypothetical protein
MAERALISTNLTIWHLSGSWGGPWCGATTVFQWLRYDLMPEDIRPDEPTLCARCFGIEHKDS